MNPFRFSQDPPRERIVRGVVGNGVGWKFTILRLNENGKDGGYKVSPPVLIELEPEPSLHVISPGPDIVAVILAHWVRHHLLSRCGMLTKPQIPRCNDDLDKNDWFVAEEGPA